MTEPRHPDISVEPGTSPLAMVTAAAHAMIAAGHDSEIPEFIADVSAGRDDSQMLAATRRWVTVSDRSPEEGKSPMRPEHPGVYVRLTTGDNRGGIMWCRLPPVPLATTTASRCAGRGNSKAGGAVWVSGWRM